MNSTFRRLGPSELLPRYIFAEALFAGRSVLEIGAVASTAGRSAQFLSVRGARSVLACDPDLGAVDSAQKSLGGPNLRYRANVFDDLESGSFELVLVADLAECVRRPELVAELRRLLADGGFLLGGLRNPAGLSFSQLVEPEPSDAPATYGQLLDVLAPHFRHVQVATQSPVLGYQVAFEQGEGLQVDGRLASAGEAAYFVVVAGQGPCRIFEPTWVQLPPEPLAYMGIRVDEYSRRSYELADRSARLKQALETTRGDLSEREEELSRMVAQLGETREEAARAWAELQALKNAGPAAARDELAGRVRRLESELEGALERLADAEGHAGRQREHLEQAQQSRAQTESQLLAAQESARLERARREELGKLLDESAARAATAKEEVCTARDEVDGLRLELQRSVALRASLQEEVDAQKSELEALQRARQSLERELGRAKDEGQTPTPEAAEAGLSAALAEVGRLSQELEAARSAEKESAQLAGSLETGLAEERERAEKDSAAAARALDALRVDARLAADRAAEREQRVAELSAEARGLEDGLEEMKRRLASAEEAMAGMRGELAAERAGAEEARQRAVEAQAAAAGAAGQVELYRGREESAGAEKRILVGERLRLSAVVERLESERARIAERLESAEAERDSLRHFADGFRDREAELATAIADRESRLEVLQRRLLAQDAELAALRRSISRTPLQVQQIYERATAELSAVKAELFRRPESGQAPAAGELEPKKI